jgi:hypothetical protein
MMRAIIILIIFLFTLQANLSAALPALSATPIEEVKPKLKRKDITEIVLDAKENFLNNPNEATVYKAFDIIDSILEDLDMSKKIALAKNPGVSFDLFLAIKATLQAIIDNQSSLKGHWQNLITVQKFKRTLLYLNNLYPQSHNINDLLSYIPKTNFKEELPEESQSDEDQQPLSNN